MRWVTYETTAGDHRVGVLVDGTIQALPENTALIDLLGDDGGRLHEAGERALRDPAEVRPVDEVRLLPPIPQPPAIRDCLCFLDHMRNCDRALGGTGELEEVWSKIPAWYFASTTGLLGARDDVAIFPGSKWFDFELEVGAVIGRGGRDLDPAKAEEHIVGYTLFCDWSARDLQVREMALRVGVAKGKDGATTLGPALVTVDEFDQYRQDGRLAMELSVELNGETMTTGRLNAMDWTFGDVIAYASRGVDVRPGEVFGSGTVPGGCLVEHKRLTDPDDPRPWLQPGDVVSLKGEGLGETRQRVVAAPDFIPLKSGA